MDIFFNKNLYLKELSWFTDQYFLCKRSPSLWNFHWDDQHPLLYYICHTIIEIKKIQYIWLVEALQPWDIKSFHNIYLLYLAWSTEDQLGTSWFSDPRCREHWYFRHTNNGYLSELVCWECIFIRQLSLGLNNVSTLSHRDRRWYSVELMFGQHPLFSGVFDPTIIVPPPSHVNRASINWSNSGKDNFAVVLCGSIISHAIGGVGTADTALDSFSNSSTSLAALVANLESP